MYIGIGGAVALVLISLLGGLVCHFKDKRASYAAVGDLKDPSDE